MEKITMTMANQIAKQMGESVYGAKQKIAARSLESKVSEYVFAHIPTEVLDMWKRYPSYFDSKSVITLVSGSVRMRYEYFECQRHPAWDGHVLNLDNDQMQIISSLHETLKRVTSDRKAFEYKVETTLISLGTYKRIKESFPEAYAYIPVEKKEETTTAIALPIQELQDIFNSAKQVTE